MSLPGHPTAADLHPRSLGLLRMLLGQLQIIAATAGLYLVITTGVNQASALVAGMTLVIGLYSRLIFSGKRPMSTKRTRSGRWGQ